MGGSSMGGGLWVSDDTGKTWSQLGWKHVKCYSVAVARYGRIIYQACGNGLLKSSDAGQSWKIMTDWRHAEVMDVATDPRDSRRVYLATAHGLWRSTDGGETWRASSDTSKPFFATRIVIDPRRPGHLIAAANSALYRSTDYGKRFKRVQTCAETPQDLEPLGRRWRVVGTPVGKRDPLFVFSDPYLPTGRFRHSSVNVGKYTFSGFLNHGVDKEFPSEGRGSSGFSTTELETLQIWRVTSAVVDE
jgi:hypothetical protein